MPGPLTERQVRRYHQQGYLCPVPLLSPNEAADQRRALEELEARFAPGGLPRPLAQYLRVSPHYVTDLPLKVALDPRLLDVVESILGPDLMLWSCEYFIKEPGSRQIVTWHQDLTYWGMGETEEEVTAWVALSPATPRSGCMRFVPGSHRLAIVPHVDTFDPANMLSRGQVIAVEVDDAEAVHAALAPGEMSLHHGRLFHASGANESADRRVGLALRYIRPETPSSSNGVDYAMLVRGVDRTLRRRNVVPPPGGFTAAHFRLYEEILAAQAAVLVEGAAQPVGLFETPASGRDTLDDRGARQGPPPSVGSL